jgi:glycosyltransferase involved in cell wall biosynthesis
VTDKILDIGIYQGPQIPQSFQVYADNVRKYLPDGAVRVIPFEEGSVPKSVDVLWDIRSGGGNAPPDFLLADALPPLVVTVHGFAPMTLNGWEYFGTVKGFIMSSHYAREKQARWYQVKKKIAAVIAVSGFVKEEAIRFTGVSADKIHVCHHGADSDFFTPHLEIKPGSYFLHISNGEPRKNIRRIVKAFGRLRRSHDVELVLKLPQHVARHYVGIDGVKVLGGILGTEELADLYRGALAFVFPSLYEGFGMPLVESMACGCPVITSDVSACREVAGEVSVTIDPRNEEALLEAMLSFCQGPSVRAYRRDAALQWVQNFSWIKSAKCHAEVFRIAAEMKR